MPGGTFPISMQQGHISRKTPSVQRGEDGRMSEFQQRAATTARAFWDSVQGFLRETIPVPAEWKLGVVAASAETLILNSPDQDFGHS